MPDSLPFRRELARIACELTRIGFNRGTAGNASTRFADGFLVTPSGMPACEMRPAEMVRMADDGSVQGHIEPSSEWRMHRDIYQARPEVHAVLHTHAPFCTALACCKRAIPPFIT